MAMHKIRTSTGWLARETIKGLPEAGKEVGGKIGKAIGTRMKFPFTILRNLRSRINIPSAELSPKEKTFRKENLMKMKDVIRKWKESHSGYKIPRAFRDLE